MKNLKDLMIEPKQDDLRFQRMHSNIMKAIENIEPKKKQFTIPSVYSIAASFLAIVIGFYIWTNMTTSSQSREVMAKLDVIASELAKEKTLMAQTTLGIGSPEDSMLRANQDKMKNLDDQELEKLFKDI